ncbi:MAG: PQQ-binding-like beta-propeller repeat protein [Pirellulaceae bacterium]|nr:PQQ-binding-like beta-propeller repeat protein [Pirellulaceae bacterium]
MSRRNISTLASGLLLILGSTVDAESRTSELISTTEARRYGLEPAWFTRVELDPARGQIGHIKYFVSAKNHRTMYEVTYGERRRMFSERDLDRLGDPIGKEGAEKAAKQFSDELGRLDIESEIKMHEVPEITLYVTTDRAMVHAIDAETGRTLWTTVVGRRDFPTECPGANEDYVAVLNGSSLYLLKRDTGKIAWIRKVDGVPAAGPAVSDHYVIVPSWNGDVELYEIEETRTLPEMYKSNGRCMVQPTVTPVSIVWPTDRGLLYVARANRHGLRYRLEAKDTIVAPAAFFAPNLLFVASVDGYVYCLQENVESEVWRFSSGESISMMPVPTGSSVYVVSDKMNLFCIDQATAELKWTAPYVKRFIAASKDRLYCLGMTDRLEILDAKSGGRIATMGANLLDVFFPNHQTDRIIVGTKTGILQCLHEIDQPLPIVHLAIAEQQLAPERPEIQQEELPAAQPKPAPKQPAAGDPFGGAGDPFGGGGGAGGAAGGGADPFGGGAGGADPFGGGGAGAGGAAGGGADPFGGAADPFR